MTGHVSHVTFHITTITWELIGIDVSTVDDGARTCSGPATLDHRIIAKGATSLVAGWML